MSKLEFTIAENISLKNSEFNEDWLQARIAENPQILGLGELDLIERERKHKSGSFIFYWRTLRMTKDMKLKLC